MSARRIFILGRLSRHLQDETPDVAFLHQTLNDLVAHFFTQFEQEERWMAQLQPDDLQAHLREHQKLTLNLFRLQVYTMSDIHRDRLSAADVLEEMLNWYHDHVLVRDHAMAKNYGSAHARNRNGAPVGETA